MVSASWRSTEPKICRRRMESSRFFFRARVFEAFEMREVSAR